MMMIMNFVKTATLYFLFVDLIGMINMQDMQQKLNKQQQQQQYRKSYEYMNRHDNNNENNDDGVVIDPQLFVPIIGILDKHQHMQKSMPHEKYDIPDDCHFLPAPIAGSLGLISGEGHSPHEIILTCNLRTVNSEFDTTNFSVIPAENTVGLHILCNDEIMAKSSLEAKSFAHLIHLQELSIQYCKLSQFNRHVLDGLQQLKNLTIRTHNTLWPSLNFDIETNAFESIKNVERLDLSSNNIWSLPENLYCYLNALVFLNMSENRLQDINELGFRYRAGEFIIDDNTTAAQVSSSSSSSTTTTTITTIKVTTITSLLKATTINAGEYKRSNQHCHLDLEILDVSYNHFVLLPSNGFGTLRRLKILHVNNNEISMLADKALNGLKSLQIINLSSNKIVALPSELFTEQATSIQEIYLQNNSISVLSPKLFSNLEQLQALDLSYNQITSTWIDRYTFVGLIRLVLLNLSHNKLTKLEPEIFNDLYTLQILNLRHNQLENIMAETFAPMNNLHTLLLSHNRLKYLDAYALNGLYVLSLLSLDNNNLIGIHPEALRNCSSLQDLNLNGNHLKSVPLALRNMRLLRTIDLGENTISVLEDAAFKGLTNLYGLRLIGNYLENITLNAFRELPNLQILNLARNRIATVQPGAFEMITSLQAIRLDGNDLSDINGLFSNMPSLLWLNISDNHLEYFDYGHIPLNLQWLDLHKNRLNDISNRFGLESQLSLQTLDASFNQIQYISSASIPNSIELLFLNDNLISRIEADTFMHKMNLTRVDLYANQIMTLDIKSLRIMSRHEYRPLPEFYIGGNPFLCDCNIDWLQKINHIKSRQYPRIMDLETIYCKLLNNRNRAYIPLIEAEPKHFLCSYTTHCFAVCHCCEFDACDCEMTCPNNCTCFHDQTWSTNIVECSRAGYTQMPRKVPMDTTELYIDGNNFVELATHSFLGRKNLAVLYINNSNVQYLYNTTFSGLKRLAILHLESNQIESLAGNEFNNLDNLRELYLQNNRLTHITDGTFQALRKLEVLRLDGNRLINFEVWQLSFNPYLVDIALANNQWSCECNYLINFRTYLAQNAKKITDAAQVSCIYNNATSVLHEINGTKCTLREDVATYTQKNDVENLLPLLLMIILTLIGLLGLTFSFFCYRQELKLWLHTNCLLSSCYKSTVFIENTDKDQTMINDAYFVYSVQDEHFVNQILSQTLENDMEYHICLHYRDIDMNAYITNAIIEANENAKQFVIVLSKNFLYNEWTRFEYRNAFHEIIKRRRRFIFILYGDLPQRDIDLDMRHYLSISTCIEWDDKKFWQKLRIALPNKQRYRHSTTNCLKSRNIYASKMMTTTSDYQATANGHLVSTDSSAIRLNDKNYSDCNNYATINECVRGYTAITNDISSSTTIATATAITASSYKFNTLTDLSHKMNHSKMDKEILHAKTLDMQHRHHNQQYQQQQQHENQRYTVQHHYHQQNQKTNQNQYQHQQHHEYDVPSYYTLNNGQVSRGGAIKNAAKTIPSTTTTSASVLTLNSTIMGNSKQHSNTNTNITGPAYDTIDYRKQSSLLESPIKPCECSRDNMATTDIVSQRTKSLMRTSFSTNFTTTPKTPIPSPVPPPPASAPISTHHTSQLANANDSLIAYNCKPLSSSLLSLSSLSMENDQKKNCACRGMTTNCSDDITNNTSNSSNNNSSDNLSHSSDTRDITEQLNQNASNLSLSDMQTTLTASSANDDDINLQQTTNNHQWEA